MPNTLHPNPHSCQLPPSALHPKPCTLQPNPLKPLNPNPHLKAIDARARGQVPQFDLSVIGRGNHHSGVVRREMHVEDGFSVAFLGAPDEGGAREVV